MVLTVLLKPVLELWFDREVFMQLIEFSLWMVILGQF
jgi:hypothetical protein